MILVCSKLCCLGARRLGIFFLPHRVEHISQLLVGERRRLNLGRTREVAGGLLEISGLSCEHTET